MSKAPIQVSWWKIWIPVALGVITAAFLFWRHFDPQVFLQLRFDFQTGIWLAIALLFLIARHFVYMIRIMVLTEGWLGWRSAFEVITLWEFATVVTPPVVGGSAAALFLLNREGLPLGRSTATVIAVIFLDHLLFVLIAPIFFLLFKSLLFSDAQALTTTFWIAYAIFTGYTLLLALGLLIRPRLLMIVLITIFSLPLLRRWKKGAMKMARDIYYTAEHFKHAGLSYWLLLLGLTGLGWLFRFLNLNAVVVAFAGTLTIFENIVLIARQTVMWVLLLVSPTPGGSGTAEFTFVEILYDIVSKGAASLLAFLWRLVSFYPYLIAGVIILPLWLKRVQQHHPSGLKRLPTFKDKTK